MSASVPAATGVYSGLDFLGNQALGLGHVARAQGRDGGFQAFLHEFGAILGKFSGQNRLVRGQCGGHVGAPHFADGGDVGFHLGGVLADFSRHLINQRIGNDQLVAQLQALDVGQLPHGCGAVFVHCLECVVGLADAVQADAANDDQQGG